MIALVKPDNRIDASPLGVVLHGDALTWLKTMESNSVDAIVTDPPAGISFMGKEWDNFNSGKKRDGQAERDAYRAVDLSRPGYANSHGTGQPTKQERDAFIAFLSAVMAEALRVLKPGGHALVWALPRTSHWTALALEDAGFEVREKLYHIFGSGFPKSMDISKAIDKMQGAEREVVGIASDFARDGCKRDASRHRSRPTNQVPDGDRWALPVTKPATPEAEQWQGWGTATKPAVEEWVYVRKPLTTVPGDEIIARTNILLEALLWSLSPAKFAEKSSASSPLIQKGASAARWLAVVLSIIESPELSALMDMFSSQEAASMYLSIAWLWNSILDALCSSTNTYTTSTKTNLITELKTLNSWLSAIIPDTITQVAYHQNGLWPSVRNVEPRSDDTNEKWKHIPLPSAQETVGTPIIRNIVKSLVSSAEILSLPIPTSIVNSAHEPAPTDTTSAKPNSPAVEEWILVRKPLAEPSIAANVLKYGTGGINVDACRVASGQDYQDTARVNDHKFGGISSFPSEKTKPGFTPAQGRWPANLLLSHSLWCQPQGTKRVRGTHRQGQPHRGQPYNAENASSYSMKNYGPWTTYTDPDGMEEIEAWQCAEDCPIRLLDEQSGVRKDTAHKRGKGWSSDGSNDGWKFEAHAKYEPTVRGYAGEGGASRYFTNLPPDVPFYYTSKASRAERNRGCEGLPEQLPPFGNSKGDGLGRGISNTRQDWPVQNSHPTVKPLNLMRWLIRLITPPDGIVLDPFCGSGSTCVAAIQEGVHFIAIEQSEEYCQIAEARIAHARGLPDVPVDTLTKRELEAWGNVLEALFPEREVSL